MGLINAFTQVSFKRIFMLTLAEGGGECPAFTGCEVRQEILQPGSRSAIPEANTGHTGSRHTKQR